MMDIFDFEKANKSIEKSLEPFYDVKYNERKIEETVDIELLLYYIGTLYKFIDDDMNYKLTILRQTVEKISNLINFKHKQNCLNFTQFKTNIIDIMKYINNKDLELIVLDLFKILCYCNADRLTIKRKRKIFKKKYEFNFKRFFDFKK